MLRLFTLKGTASVKLASFGVVGFVFARGAPADLVGYVRSLRTGGASKKEYTLPWSIDVPAGRVHDHGFLPRGPFPRRKWVASVLGGAP